jgi:hypothetical protein
LVKGTHFLSAAVALVILLALAVGLSAAQGPVFQQIDSPQANSVGTKAVSSAGEPAAALGTDFTYQGRLTDAAGAVDDTCSFQFGLWDDATAGMLVAGPLGVNGVSISHGLFTVALDFGTVFEGTALWLEVAVQCPGDTGYTTLDPRQALTAAPYALSLRPGAVISGTVADGSILTAFNETSIGVSVMGLQAGYDLGDLGPFSQPAGFFGGRNGIIAISKAMGGNGVTGLSSATNGISAGVYGRADSSAGYGVFGYADMITGTARGIYGMSRSTEGSGVYGYAGSTTGANFGVYGMSRSTEGSGVYGYASANDGYNYGVYGVSDSIDGRGVYGCATSTEGDAFGVGGRTDSEYGAGVYGYAPTAHGVFGRSDSTDGHGVYGMTLSSTGYTDGVYGIAYSTQGRGVYGYANATSGSAYGVLGRTDSPAGYGVFYEGGLGGTGLQSTLVETQEYGWRQLYNVGSAAALFEDVGTVQLQVGRAEVIVDPVFRQTVNTKEPYQVFVTALGAEPVLLYVTEKNATSFTLEGVTLDGRPAQCAVDYRIVAKRLGYEDVRMSTATAPPPPEEGLWGGE